MNIKGKIVQIVEEQSGESAKGPWRKQEYILQTDGEYMTPHNHAKGDGFQPQQNTLENFNDEF